MIDSNFNIQYNLKYMINLTSQQKTVQIQQIEKSLHKSLTELESYYTKANSIEGATRQNNQIIIPILYDTISNTFKPLEYILRFLTDSDLMNVGATCRTLYRIIYSPLGFRICRYLRPTIIVKSQTLEEQIPQFTQATVDQLCSDKNLQNADEDDKLAILLTMKTNILATKQKIDELDLIIEAYDKKYQKIQKQIINIGRQRQQQQQKLSIIQNEIQKLRQLLKQSDGHAQSLKKQQQNIQMQRELKMTLLNDQKIKLSRQKDLLIKKIKNQQKQKQQGMIYAKQVTRILMKLNQITNNAISNNKK